MSSFLGPYLAISRKKPAAPTTASAASWFREESATSASEPSTDWQIGLPPAIPAEDVAQAAQFAAHKQVLLAAPETIQGKSGW